MGEIIDMVDRQEDLKQVRRSQFAKRAEVLAKLRAVCRCLHNLEIFEGFAPLIRDLAAAKLRLETEAARLDESLNRDRREK
jgi:hypothetical protein